MKAGGDTRSPAGLREEGARRIESLRRRGYDLGYGHGPDFGAPPEVKSRMEAIYRHARRALYATFNEAVIRDVSPRRLRVRTAARDREEYLSHPPSGERICNEDAGRLATLYPARRPQVQFVLSDGLNADALHENLRALLPQLRRGLVEAARHVGEVDVLIENGRVRAGYHVGALLGVDLIIHLIGERPGTGLNTLSAYLTYGRDEAGRLRWGPDLNHSCTTAVCGINSRGKRPDAAAAEITRCVERMLEERRSGVVLGSASRF
jgi:ethanolamine ammonia-lyase large subunit